MGFLSFIPAIASVASSLFGGKKAQPSTSTSKSGFETLPREVQDAYTKSYLPNVLRYYNNGPNQMQQQAYGSLGGGLNSITQELPQYMDVFRQNVTNPTLDEIQRQADIQKNRLNAQAGNNGLGGYLNSALGVERSGVQEGADRLKANVNYAGNRENLMNALALRQSTLQDVLNGGDQNYQMLSRLAGLLGAFPGGSTSTSIGATEAGPNGWDKAAGAATSLSSLANNYINQYSDTPWKYGAY